MSLFDYHGRFRGSNKSHDESTDPAEDQISMSEEVLEPEQDDLESDTLQNAQKAKDQDSNETKTDQNNDVLESSNDTETENTASKNKADSLDKGESHSDDQNDSLNTSLKNDIASDEDLQNAQPSTIDEENGSVVDGLAPANEADDAFENEDSSEQATTDALSDEDEQEEATEIAKKTATDDPAEESSTNASDDKHSKKKKTKASKGKHAAGANNTESDIDAKEITDTNKDFELPTTKKSRGILKGIGITVCILIAIVALTYGAGVVVFMNRILPNTLLGSHDISLCTNEEAIQLLESIEKNYTIQVETGTFSYSISKADIGLELNASKIVEAIHKKYDAFLWPLYIFDSNHDITDELAISFDPEGYEAGFVKAIEDYNKGQTPPTDAYIYYDETAKRYLVVDETMGTQIDPDRALQALDRAISELQPILHLTTAEMYQPKVRGNDESLIETAKLASSLVSAKISLTVNDATVREIKPSELSKCIHIDENAQLAFDENVLNELCDSIVQEFNTIGTERTYTRPDGKVVTVHGGVYGWSVNEDALKEALFDAIKRADPVTIVVPFETTADVYVAPGQRDWGNRYIDIDLSEQHVRFYDENGALFWETDCITGSPDGVHNTPQGVWRINDMESPSKLIGYENGKKIYESHVTYWMPFIRNSIGLHDATWQPGFGGSMYANGYGSHGCVNISYRAAQELYGLIRVGDVVVTHF